MNIVILSVRWQKMALLLLPKGRLCVSGQKQMCRLCGWLKLSFDFAQDDKKVRWKKIKNAEGLAMSVGKRSAD
ncbi:MAG: hypothetical protein Q7U47_04515 [Paludibacter sp.]|nr:hypothetical protein [Paludibacter sp.]